MEKHTELGQSEQQQQQPQQWYQRWSNLGLNGSVVASESVPYSWDQLVIESMRQAEQRPTIRTSHANVSLQ
jgi:hypothetical protein